MNHYDTLGVPCDASQAEIKIKYRKLAKKTHPDHNGEYTDLFKEITHAFEVLSDPERRARYDKHGIDCPPAQRLIETYVANLLLTAFLSDGDPIESVKTQLRGKMKERKESKRQGEDIRSMLTKKIDRFKDRNNNTTNTEARDFIVQAIENHLEKVRVKLAEEDREIALLGDCLSYLDGLSASEATAFTYSPPTSTVTWG